MARITKPDIFLRCPAHRRDRRVGVVDGPGPPRDAIVAGALGRFDRGKRVGLRPLREDQIDEAGIAVVALPVGGPKGGEVLLRGIELPQREAGVEVFRVRDGKQLAEGVGGFHAHRRRGRCGIGGGAGLMLGAGRRSVFRCRYDRRGLLRPVRGEAGEKAECCRDGEKVASHGDHLTGTIEVLTPGQGEVSGGKLGWRQDAAVHSRNAGEPPAPLFFL